MNQNTILDFPVLLLSLVSQESVEYINANLKKTQHHSKNTRK